MKDVVSIRREITAAIVIAVVASLGACGSAPPVADIAGRNVIEVREGIVNVGVANKPSGAQPVALTAPRSVWLGGCHTRKEIDDAYGARCSGFAPTAHGGSTDGKSAGASSTPAAPAPSVAPPSNSAAKPEMPSGVAPSTPGRHPTETEEAWYCGDAWTVRVAYSRCTSASATEEGTFRVIQAVLARAPETVQ